MHELSIATALVEQVAAIVAREGGGRAVRIGVSVGALSGVDADALALAFPVAAESTVCAAAALDIAVVPARAHCRDCACDCEPPFPFMVCDRCGSVNTDVLAGRDLLLTAVELQTG
jgi:hydrogenase nickel incorporation protein HypA/HybF